jgi:hypothetical protein
VQQPITVSSMNACSSARGVAGGTFAFCSALSEALKEALDESRNYDNRHKFSRHYFGDR